MFDRTVLYGHASDIGKHLIFQDLSALQAGDSITVDTALGRFIDVVDAMVTRTKAALDGMAALYDYPADGRKEIGPGRVPFGHHEQRRRVRSLGGGADAARLSSGPAQTSVVLLGGAARWWA